MTHDDSVTTTRPLTRRITEGSVMRVRHHHGFGHGLRPGTDSDINCLSCRREDAAVIDLVLGTDGVWAVKA